MSGAEVAIHALLVAATLVCYAVLEALGHDATPLLGVLAGQGLGAAGDRVARRVTP